MVQQHFEGEKDRLYFLVNNFDYVYSNLQILHLEKGVQDVIQIEKELNELLEKLIKVILRENYPGMEEIVGKYCMSGDSSSESEGDDKMPHHLKKVDLSELNVRLLETVTQDFAQNYRPKTDMIAKELKQTVQS